MPVEPIPAGHHTVTPYLVVRGLASLLPFLEKGLGATVVERHDDPSGAVFHAEVRIGDSFVMLGEAAPKDAPRPGMLYLYVRDVDAAFARAVAAGATVLRPVANQFYGDRSGGVADACGNQWWFATHVEDVAPDELARRKSAQSKG